MPDQEILTPEEIQEQLLQELEGGSPEAAPEAAPDAPAEAEAEAPESEEEEGAEAPEQASDEAEEDPSEQMAALEAELAEARAELKGLRDALDMRLQEDLDSLSKEDRALVEDMADGDALEKSRVLSKLLKAGKIVKKGHNPAQDLRAGQRVPEGVPSTPEEAAQQVLKALEARAI